MNETELERRNTVKSDFQDTNKHSGISGISRFGCSDFVCDKMAILFYRRLSSLIIHCGVDSTPHKEAPPKYMEIVNKLTLADAKEAGPFLDGCKVYLSGFTPDVCENLSGILNAGGATRLNELSDSVSHIVVGDHVPEDVNYRKKSGIRPHVVTVDWLLESMKQRHPAPESHFLVFVKPTELPLRLSRKPLSKIKGQSGETFGGINIPRKRKAEELQQKDGDTLASPPAATRVRIFSPVAGTSRDNVQPESSSQTGVKQPPKILISSMKDKRAYVKMIMDLGGIVSYKSVFDPTTTHLICSRPGWYKKTACCNLLLCIASGKWILHKSFIDASCRAGTFVEEEEYEFGNPKAEKLWGKLQPRSMQMALAKAGYRWRRKLCGGNSGPFTGMRAIVCTKQKKAVLLAQVIKAGGGEVLDIRPPCKDPQGATHCFADIKDLSEPIDMEALIKNKVPCLYPVYILAYLVKEPPPDAKRYILPEYKWIMAQLDRL